MFWVVSVLAFLAILAVVLYAYGGPMPASAEAKAAYAAEVAAGRQGAVPLDRFVIPIPGCTCHSDDPVLQVQHSVRRINTCTACHSRG